MSERGADRSTIACREVSASFIESAMRLRTMCTTNLAPDASYLTSPDLLLRPVDEYALLAEVEPGKCQREDTFTRI